MSDDSHPIQILKGEVNEPWLIFCYDGCGPDWALALLHANIRFCYTGDSKEKVGIHHEFTISKTELDESELAALTASFLVAWRVKTGTKK